MKKPTNKPIEIREMYSGNIDLSNMNLEDLYNLQRYMMLNNIDRIEHELYWEYEDSCYIEYWVVKIESQLDADIRYEKELKLYEQSKLKSRSSLKCRKK